MKLLIPFALSSLLLPALLTHAPAYGQGLLIPPYRVDKNKRVFQVRCIFKHYSREMLAELGDRAMGETLINLNTREMRVLALPNFSIPITEVTPTKIVAEKRYNRGEVFVYTLNRDTMELYWERQINGAKKEGIVKTCVEVRID